MIVEGWGAGVEFMYFSKGGFFFLFLDIISIFSFFVLVDINE